MSTSARRCKARVCGGQGTLLIADGCRFVDCEKWRKDTGLDEAVPTWEYPEKEEIFKYYPQYYHKTDKVGP